MKYKQALLYSTFALLGILLLWLALRGVDFKLLQAEWQKIDNRWLLVLLIPSLLAQVFRVLRWQLLLKQTHENIGFITLYHSLLFGYFVNLGLPRVGEVSRCISLQKLQNIPTLKSLATVVNERIADMLFLVLFVGFAFFIQTDTLKLFWLENIYEPLLKSVFSKLAILIPAFVIAVLVLIFFVRRYKSKWKTSRMANYFYQFYVSLQSILTLKSSSLLLFVLLSCCIWTCYFFTTWLWFFALSGTFSLPFYAAFSIMAVGSIAKTIPIQGGGMGAYHFLVGNLLLSYGLSDVGAQTFALLNHGYQTVFYLLFGGFSAIYLVLKRKNFG